MTPERWHEIEKLYESAIALSPTERVHFVADISDLALRREVESLLDVQADRESFLDQPFLARGPRTAPLLEAATRIGPYVITGVLGTGGMGEVYKARDQRLGREVAMKFLPEDSCDDVSALDRMQREARAASALNHPRICTLHDIGEHEGRPFLVMELLEGASLKERLAAGPLAVMDVISIGVQITDALTAAHAKGIVHRDIKPTNIFVNPRGEIKVLDFGLAKLITEATRDAGALAAGLAPESDRMTLSIPGAAYGTAPYMSPEQVRGEPVDARSDLFSVGVTLYEMATGRVPFQRDTVEQTVAAIAADSPIPPHAVNSSVPSKLETIILKALDKDRSSRYQSAAELGSDLARLSVSRSRARRWKIAAAATLVLAAAAGAAIKSGFFGMAPPVPELTLRRVTANPIQDAVFRGSMSSDGQYAAYSDLRGVHIRRIDTGETRSISAPEGLCFR